MFNNSSPSEPALAPARANAVINAQCYRMDYEVLHGEASALARFGSVQLGPLTICQHHGYGTHRSSRGPQHIREDGVEDFIVCLPLHGDMRLQQNGCETRLAPGQFALMTTARPYCGSIGCGDDADPFSCFQVRVSNQELRERVPDIDAQCIRPMPIQRGPSRMMPALFELALHNGEDLPWRQAAQLRSLLLDTVADSVLDASGPGDTAARASRTSVQRILATAKSFIDRHLDDPSLDVERIAAHCHVSLRTLQNAFAAASLTVVGHIRERRLHVCRAALRDPSLRDRSLTTIATGSGFNDLAYFSRAYRARYGVAPSQDRAVPDQPVGPGTT